MTKGKFFTTFSGKTNTLTSTHMKPRAGSAMRRSSSMTIKRKFLICLLTFVLLAAFPISTYAAESSSKSGMQVLEEIMNLLRDHHLQNVSQEQLVDAAIRGMVESLDDPYTVYMNAEEWEGYQNSIEQEYVGIGIQLGEDERGVYAQDVFPDSPAQEAGILKGDYIIAVNGQDTTDKTADEIVEMILGDENTTVEVTISRAGAPMTYKMERRPVKIPNVETRWFSEGYGYIHIKMFSNDADELVEEAVKEMKKKGLKGLVVDVRGNPGGYLDTVAYITGEFLADGVVMHTRDKDGLDSPISIQNGNQLDVPVVILIDERSASGSEVLAGALQDHKLAKVIGVPSYGKGSVQSIFPLSNGGVLKTTVQEYLTPHGHPVNGVGIKPDLEVQGSLPQLLTGLREVGLTKLTLRAAQHELLINDVNFKESLPYIVQEDRVYVHSRVLAALSGLQVTWDGAAQQVVLQGHNTDYRYSLGAPEVLQQEGMTYLELNSFADEAAGFSWSYADGVLTLSIE